MKHRTKILWLSSVVLLSGGAPSIQADRMDARTARSIATSFVSANSSKYKKVPTRMTDDPVYSPDVNGEPAMYVFNNPDNNGFTIVSGDDNLPTILGYSTEGSFDYDSIPENMKTLIDGYIKQISHYFNSGARKRVIVSYPVHSQINQLLKTTWNQDSPFNDMCPTSGGQHMPTGCSATATAQVMKFHQWPPKGNGVTLKGWISTTLNIIGTLWSTTTMGMKVRRAARRSPRSFTR